jgi:hypothetical protein
VSEDNPALGQGEIRLHGSSGFGVRCAERGQKYKYLSDDKTDFLINKINGAGPVMNGYRFCLTIFLATKTRRHKDFLRLLFQVAAHKCKAVSAYRSY